MDRGQEGGAVFTHAAALDTDKAGQVRVFGAEAVADPRAHGGTHFGKGAGVKLQRRAGVLRVVGVHAAQEAEVIGDGGEVRHQIGDHHAALSARTHRSHGLEREKLIRADLGDFLAQG